VRIQEPGQYIDGRTRRYAIFEGYENYFITAMRGAISGPMLPDEHAVLEGTTQMKIPTSAFAVTGKAIPARMRGTPNNRVELCKLLRRNPILRMNRPAELRAQRADTT
jgi:hypothetical protein